ncbi:MAG: hypothetical protein KatS3mg061_1172 [Dehalococcoidia bacterium]|nr:MAG: hypothetical protein KatS3mg061_1172 [Dehalococcoidia bacterium]
MTVLPTTYVFDDRSAYFERLVRELDPTTGDTLAPTR